MTRVAMLKPEIVDDPIVREIFKWVAEAEGSVPNHFYVELNFPEYMKAKLGSTRVLWEQGELTMAEIQHVGVLVSRANGCPYCTAAFCTILKVGLGTAESYVERLVQQGVSLVEDERLTYILDFALRVNAEPKAISDEDVDGLRALGLTDKGVVQLVHLVSDFASYNRLNLALDTDYDYDEMWRAAASHSEKSAV